MFLHKIILFIFIAFDFCFSESLDAEKPSNNTEVFENNQENLHLKHSEIIYHNFLISAQSSSKELGISIIPSNIRLPSGELSIFYSNSIKYPTELNNSKSCLNLKMMGYCIFPIPQSENASNVYFSFICETEECQFKWRLNHIEEINLKYGVPEYFIFHKNEFETFNITVPSKQNFSRIVFSLEYKYIPINYHLKNDVNFSQGQPHMKRLTDREVFILYSNDTTLCFQCNISVTAFLPKESIVIANAWIFQASLNEIHLNETVTDFLFASQKNNIYFLNLNLNDSKTISDDHSLFISFKSLSGTKKTLYVSPDQEISDFAKAPWNSTLVDEYYEEEDIIIDKKDLNSLSLKGNQFFLYVSGDINGLYMIHANINNKKFLPIYLGVRESGLILNNEIVNYEYEFWKTEDFTKLILTSTMTSGHLNLYVRKCESNSNSCLITKEDIEKNNNIENRVTKDGLNMLEFTPKCDFNAAAACYYIFAVMGNSNSSKSNKYSLVLKRTENEIVLIENMFHETHLGVYHSQIFKLIVEDYSDPEKEVTSISFLINQDIIYIVSKDVFCYDYTNSSCNSKMGNFLYPVTFQKNEKSSLNGVYYLMLLGTQRSNIVIYPRVIRKDSLNMIKLLEGKIFRSSLIESIPNEYFKFHISSEKPIMVEINLHSSVNHGIRMYISKDGEPPNPQKYFLSSVNNYISFYHSHNDNDKFYILLVEARENLQSLPNKKMDFSLMYSTESTVKHLEPNQIFYDFIESGQQKHLIFFPGLDEESITISKHAFMPINSEKFLKMSLSILLKEDSYFIIENNMQNNIVVNQTILKNYCGDRGNIEECPFYITLENLLDEQIHYSILMRYQDHSINLVDGKEFHYLAETNTKIFMHYFPTSRNENLDLFSYSQGVSFNLYLQIFHNVNKTNSLNWPYENLISTNSSYINKNSYFLSLNSSIFKDCWPDCVVLIAIVANNSQLNIFNPTSHAIHIMLSSKMSDLSENKYIELSIEKDQAKYFVYDLSHFMSSNLETLVFEVATNYGTTELLITVNSANEEKIPSRDEFDFISKSGNLLITKKEIESVSKNKNSKKLHLFVAIDCLSSSCDASLRLETSKLQLKYLLHGKTYPIFLEKGETQNYEYYHYQDNSFNVKFNKETGIGNLKVINCNKTSSSDTCSTQNINLSEVNSNFSDFWSNSIKIDKNNPDYCLNCMYIISFSAISALKGSIHLVLDNEFFNLQEGKKLLDEVEEHEQNLYLIKFSLNKEIKVLLNVYSGDPQVFISSFPKLDKNKYELMAAHTNNSLITIDFKPSLQSDKKEINVYAYILVYGKEKTHYSITYKTEESLLFLHEGLIEFDTLQKGKTNRYIFEIYHASGTPSLSINLKKENISIESIKISSFFRAQKTIYDTSNHLSVLLLSKENVILSENSITILLLNATGHYEFEISNLNNVEIFYSIIVNSQFINLIPYNSIINQIIPAERALLYETYVPNKGFFMFEIMECSGEVKLFISEDYDKFTKQIFNEEFQASEGVSRFNTIQVKKGMIYFALYSAPRFKFVDTHQTTKAYFKLTTHYYDSPEEIPQNKLIPGNNGRISWEYLTQSNKIKISFEPLRCLGECPVYFKHVFVSYWIILSKNENLLNTYGKCSIINYENIKMNSSNFQSKFIVGNNLIGSNRLENFNYEFDYFGDIYYASVKAKIQNYPGNHEPFFMYYEDIEIEKPPLKVVKVVYYGLTVFAICLVVLLSLCCVYYYRSYKKLEENLNYEVKDVDNGSNVITTLNASIEMQPSSKRYQGLIEESGNF